MLCFVVVMQSFIMNSHEVFIHIHQGCFAGTGAIVRLPQCQWSKPDGYGKISQCITTTKHSKAKTVCIFLGIYCMIETVPRKGWMIYVPKPTNTTKLRPCLYFARWIIIVALIFLMYVIIKQSLVSNIFWNGVSGFQTVNLYIDLLFHI